jgi:hypothetical protein
MMLEPCVIEQPYPAPVQWSTVTAASGAHGAAEGPSCLGPALRQIASSAGGVHMPSTGRALVWELDSNSTDLLVQEVPARRPFAFCCLLTSRRARDQTRIYKFGVCTLCEYIVPWRRSSW